MNEIQAGYLADAVADAISYLDDSEIKTLQSGRKYESEIAMDMIIGAVQEAIEEATTVDIKKAIKVRIEAILAEKK